MKSNFSIVMALAPFIYFWIPYFFYFDNFTKGGVWGIIFFSIAGIVLQELILLVSLFTCWKDAQQRKIVLALLVYCPLLIAIFYTFLFRDR